MNKKGFVILGFMGLLVPSFLAAASAQEGLILDFSDGHYRNSLGLDIEIWLKDDGSDETQSCAMAFSADDALGDPNGRSLRMDYDVDSPNPAYNGVRTYLDAYDASGFTHLNLYLKGDPQKGFSDKLKIELIGDTGRPSPYILSDITDQWQKFQIPLSEFFAVADWTAVEKFVVVFADITNDPKVGTIYLDQVYFSKEG